MKSKSLRTYVLKLCTASLEIGTLLLDRWLSAWNELYLRSTFAQQLIGKSPVAQSLVAVLVILLFFGAIFVAVGSVLSFSPSPIHAVHAALTYSLDVTFFQGRTAGIGRSDATAKAVEAILKKSKTDHKLTVSQIALEMGVSSKVIDSWKAANEKYRKMPSRKYLLLFCVAARSSYLLSRSVFAAAGYGLEYSISEDRLYLDLLSNPSIGVEEADLLYQKEFGESLFPSQ